MTCNTKVMWGRMYNQLFKKQSHHNTYNWKILANFECVCVYIYILKS
jgi:hypothetical protein